MRPTAASSCRSFCLGEHSIFACAFRPYNRFGINSQSFASGGSISLHSLQHLQAGLFEDTRCFGKIFPSFGLCFSLSSFPLWMPACFGSVWIFNPCHIFSVRNLPADLCRFLFRHSSTRIFKRLSYSASRWICRTQKNHSLSVHFQTARGPSLSPYCQCLLSRSPLPAP